MATLRRSWLRSSLMLALLVVGGCSAGTRLGYNHLDTLVAWRLSDYVRLDATQKPAFKRSFDALWDWHRQTQLPRYAQDLRRLAAEVGEAVPTRAAAELQIATIERHGDALGEKIGSALAPLIPVLDDAQVAGLIAHQRQEIERDERKHADETPEARRKRYLRRVADFYDGWVGDLNETQKAAAERAWTRGLATLPSAAQRRQGRLDDLQRLEALFAQRHAADFPERLRKFGDDDPELPATERGRSEAATRARQRQLTLDVLTALDAAQRRKLQARLLELAEDCEALAAEPRRAASEAAARP
ncbi:MAG: hypothetical protein NVS9B10_13380 [Nevskia sp.]